MHRVECESCKASYQVDERRIPPNGLKMRCPKCGHTFIVKLEGGKALVLPIKPGAVPAATPSSPTAGAPDSAPKSRPSAAPEADDPFADLPSAAKSPGADLPAAKRIAAPTRPERLPPNLAKAAAAIAKPAAAAPTKPATPPIAKQAPPRPAITPSLDDLPAVGEKFGAKFGKPALPTFAKPAAPKQNVPELGDLDVDLPSAAKKPALPATVPGRSPPQKIPPRPPAPMPTPSLELEMNLPSVSGKPDLPAIPARSQKLRQHQDPHLQPLRRHPCLRGRHSNRTRRSVKSIFRRLVRRCPPFRMQRSRRWLRRFHPWQRRFRKSRIRCPQSRRRFRRISTVFLRKPRACR